MGGGAGPAGGRGPPGRRRRVKARLRDAAEFGIEELTVFSFSTENWQRPQAEVDGLMAMFAERIDRETPELDEEGVRMRFIGRRDGIGAELVERMDWAEDETAANERITLFVAFNYGGRAEIVDAARSFEGGHRGGVPRPPLRARDARPRPTDPHQWRAADLQLPALAVRLLGARVQRRALARLRPRRVRGGARRVREPRGGASGAADGGLASRSTPSSTSTTRAATGRPSRRRCGAARGAGREATASGRRAAGAPRPSPGSPGRCRGSRSRSRSSSSAASCSPRR